MAEQQNKNVRKRERERKKERKTEYRFQLKTGKTIVSNCKDFSVDFHFLLPLFTSNQEKFSHLFFLKFFFYLFTFFHLFFILFFLNSLDVFVNQKRKPQKHWMPSVQFLPNNYLFFFFFLFFSRWWATKFHYCIIAHLFLQIVCICG